VAWTERFRDTFTESAGVYPDLDSHTPDVGASWAKDSGRWRANGDDDIAQPLTNLDCFEAVASIALADDQAVETKVNSSTDENGIVARYTYTGDGTNIVFTGYMLAWFASSNSLKLYRMDGAWGGRTQLASTDTTAHSAGDLMRIEAVGTSLEAKVNGSTRIGPTTDATYSSGGFGLVSPGGNASFDDYAGYDDAGSGTSAAPGVGAMVLAGQAIRLGFTINLPDEA
jgi:hypothetical protein